MELIASHGMTFLQLFLAMVLGGLVGLERTLAGKTAGLRTFALVCMGSTLFVLIAALISEEFAVISNYDPLRVASSIVTGIGFIGAGLIIFDNKAVHGLTTAAGLWVSAAIGVAIGFEMYLIAVFATALVLFTFVPMWHLERMVKRSVTFDKSAFEDDEGSN